MHQKIQQWLKEATQGSLIIVVRGKIGSCTAPCNHTPSPNESIGGREKIDGRTAICDECRLHAQRLQHLHLSIKSINVDLLI